MVNFSKLHLAKNGKRTSYFIRDAVHNEIEFSGNNLWIYDLVNTPEMQRLGKILQLGLSHHNFPTVTHTRLSHCLGTYQVCQKIIHRLIINGDLIINPSTQITINLALTSALLHDIGHGPHSHAFEKYLNFSHEQNATNLLLTPTTAIHKILSKKAVNDQLPANYYVTNIAKIINKQNDDPKLSWVQDLISSQIDADRLDYLLRDSYFSGINYGKINLDLLIKWIRITNQTMNYEGNNNQQWCQRIAFSEKAKLLIHNFLNARLAMYWELYENNYSTAYEQLISLMIQRFKLLFQKGQEKKLITNYYFLFQLIIPYFATQPQFNYQQFLQLNDETFNLIIDKFQQADDPTLRSLAYLFHGRINQSQHCLLRVDRKTANFLQQQYHLFHQKKYDERVVLELMENGPVKLYNQKEQLLIYDQPQNLVLNGWKYLIAKELIPSQPIITPKESTKIALVSKNFWNTIKIRQDYE